MKKLQVPAALSVVLKSRDAAERKNYGRERKTEEKLTFNSRTENNKRFVRTRRKLTLVLETVYHKINVLNNQETVFPSVI